MKTVERKPARSKLVLMDDERVSVAVDTHKRSYAVGVWSLKRGLVAQWNQSANPKSLLTKLKPIAGRIDVLAYEAGPTGFGLAREAMAVGLQVLVAAPSLIPSAPGRHAKTDRLDCIRLAELAAKGMLKPAFIPSEQEQADRQVIRLREQFARKQRRVKQQIKSFLLNYGIEEPQGLKYWTLTSLRELRALQLQNQVRFCLDQLLDELGFIMGRMKQVEVRLKELAATERHKAIVDHLCTAPGVGLLTAMTMRLEMLHPERFRKAAQVARAAGLAPGVTQSGETRRGGPILKSGNARLRTILVEASWRAIRKDPHLRKRYVRLCLNTGSKKKAIVGVARHLVEHLWRLMLAPAQQGLQTA